MKEPSKISIGGGVSVCTAHDRRVKDDKPGRHMMDDTLCRRDRDEHGEKQPKAVSW